ncbi:EamA family transporter [Lysinibacter cavernae]|uniref:Inner membrane transporter RhtA n=1 Tax=Lysinibacter cavernae TaxID=1640652 RepID=A0A7X5QYV1_9MICO|nr:EamA family transporter [Lysinibacter cavernae]NIH52466.1 inner membrane transporter RhtA [Lysinibacter cavernae]
MTVPARANGSAALPIPPWGMAVTAMLLIQLSSSLSVGLIGEVGAAATAWLRLTMGAVIFIAVARPPIRSIRRQDVLPLIGLGTATGVMSIGFLAAIERIPLGTAVAIEFLGPLLVAGFRSSNRRMLTWPALALIGVVLMTEPWNGGVELLGISYALIAGIGWGTYIVLTQKVGDRFSGISGLSISIPIAAILATFVGLPQASGNITWQILLAALGLAVLSPVLPFVLEMLALKRMTHTAFGTLMALEPAFGVLLGLLVLHQIPSAVQIVGISLVVFAGAAAQRGGLRASASPPTANPEPTIGHA